MDLIDDDSKQVLQLERDFAHSIPDGNIRNIKLGMVDLFEEKMILGTVNLWQAVSVLVDLVVDRTLG